MSKKHEKNYTDEQLKRDMEPVSWAEVKARHIKNPETKKAYDDLEFEFSLIRVLVTERARQNLTQRQLAKKVGVAQSALARLESGRANPTLRSVLKLMESLGVRLKIVKA